VDLTVRDAQLAGTVGTEWNDVDGDRFASAGDTVTYTYTVGNAGNVWLTGLSAPAASISQDTLAAGGTVTATREHVLTAADIAAGKLDAVAFEATASNGANAATATVTGGEVLLDLKPAEPGTDPVLAVQDLDKQTAPFDLGTLDKYRDGQKAVSDCPGHCGHA
jgi:sialidase-1